MFRVLTTPECTYIQSYRVIKKAGPEPSANAILPRTFHELPAKRPRNSIAHIKSRWERSNGRQSGWPKSAVWSQSALSMRETVGDIVFLGEFLRNRLIGTMLRVG